MGGRTFAAEEVSRNLDPFLGICRCAVLSVAAAAASRRHRASVLSAADLLAVSGSAPFLIRCFAMTALVFMILRALMGSGRDFVIGLIGLRASQKGWDGCGGRTGFLGARVNELCTEWAVAVVSFLYWQKE